MKKVLVTGGAGFIGSNYVNHQVSLGKNHIVNLDIFSVNGFADNGRD